MTRQGLNCTLAYSDGNATRVYRVRCSSLSWGYDMIATESAARLTRGFYPHQTAPTRFALRIDLIGKEERRSFNGYLMNYANYILDPSVKGRETPQMTVTIPSRGFKRIGVPLSGMEFGIRVAQVFYQPTLVFETSGEPLDWSEHDIISTVQADLAYFKQPESQYFYPTGLQLKGGESPAVAGYQSIQEAINGSAINPTANKPKVFPGADF